MARVLKRWREADITLIIDGTMVFGDRFQICRFSLLQGWRVIAIVWKVIPGKGNTKVEVLEEIFRQAAEFLRPRVKSVTVLGERGFRDCYWAQLCLELG
ncbi:MAG: hypothetical protein AB1489_29040 [Acidobacteriota bacterium]